MTRFAPSVKHAPNSLAEVSDAAWVVVGRRSYAFNHDEVDQLRLDLAVCVGQMVANGVTDTRISFEVRSCIFFTSARSQASSEPPKLEREIEIFPTSE